MIVSHFSINEFIDIKTMASFNEEHLKQLSDRINAVIRSHVTIQRGIFDVLGLSETPTEEEIKQAITGMDPEDPNIKQLAEKLQTVVQSVAPGVLMYNVMSDSLQNLLMMAVFFLQHATGSVPVDPDSSEPSATSNEDTDVVVKPVPKTPKTSKKPKRPRTPKAPRKPCNSVRRSKRRQPERSCNSKRKR